jgi:hypothetical protein
MKLAITKELILARFAGETFTLSAPDLLKVCAAEAESLGRDAALRRPDAAQN